MTQLVSPNLNAVGQIGYCLAYASRGVFGNPAPGTTAWQAWLQTQYRYLDQQFPSGVSFPVWFSGAGGAGHVAVYTPSGIYSSPWQLGTTHAVLPSISEVERIYGVLYVGWSEDILNLRVIGDSMTPQEVSEAYANYSGQVVPAGSPPTLNRQPLEFFRGLCLSNYDTIKALEAEIATSPSDVVPYSGPPLYEKK